MLDTPGQVIRLIMFIGFIFTGSIGGYNIYDANQNDRTDPFKIVLRSSYAEPVVYELGYQLEDRGNKEMPWLEFNGVPELATISVPQNEEQVVNVSVGIKKNLWSSLTGGLAAGDFSGTVFLKSSLGGSPLEYPIEFHVVSLWRTMLPAILSFLFFAGFFGLMCFICLVNLDAPTGRLEVWRLMRESEADREDPAGSEGSFFKFDQFDSDGEESPDDQSPVGGMTFEEFDKSTEAKSKLHYVPDDSAQVVFLYQKRSRIPWLRDLLTANGSWPFTNSFTIKAGDGEYEFPAFKMEFLVGQVKIKCKRARIFYTHDPQQIGMGMPKRKFDTLQDGDYLYFEMDDDLEEIEICDQEYEYLLLYRSGESNDDNATEPGGGLFDGDSAGDDDDQPFEFS